MPYIHRIAEPIIKQYLSSFPVVGITGPRQSGKSTMLQHLLSKKYRYVTFDDYRVAEEYHKDPAAFMDKFNDAVVFDEVQIVPDIFSHIKLAVDRDRQRYGKFVLTGSSQFAFMKYVSESLAGRIGLLTLLPFQYSELPARRRTSSIVFGSYPELVMRNYRESKGWYSSYLETYLSRDVRSLSNIGDIREFRQCIGLLAARVGQIVNYSDLSRDIGVSVPTIKQWISILEASYVIFLVRPYFKNFGKRIIKSPKVYFYDTGLISYLLGIDDAEAMQRNHHYGNLFENYIISEIAKKELHTKSHSELYYFRTNHGVEVDLIIDRRNTLEYVEVKSTKTFRPEMANSIRQLLRKGEKGFVLYQGKDIPFGKDIFVLKYSKYLSR
ncbi:MAG: ATP-binding protein [Bacteroidota bacterium]